MLTLSEFSFLQKKISNLADDAFFDDSLEIDADASLVQLLSDNGFRTTMVSSDKSLNIAILDKLDDNDAQQLSDEEKFEVNLKDFFDNYMFIYDTNKLVDYENVVFATNTRFGVNQYRYLLQNIDLLKVSTTLFKVLFDVKNMVNALPKDLQ